MISEYLPDAEPQRYYFPQRNRIISGLSGDSLWWCRPSAWQRRVDNSRACSRAGQGSVHSARQCGQPVQYRQQQVDPGKGLALVLSPGDVLEMMGVSAFGLEDRRNELLGESRAAGFP